MCRAALDPEPSGQAARMPRKISAHVHDWSGHQTNLLHSLHCLLVHEEEIGMECVGTTKSVKVLTYSSFDSRRSSGPVATSNDSILIQLSTALIAGSFKRFNNSDESE